MAGVPLGPGIARAAPRAKAPARPSPKTPDQKEAERHFQSGVALFKESKYAEALAEFERAYEISPQPLVLYNIAGCHRELSHYREAVAYYRRFLAEGKGKAKPERLAAAQGELDAILARIARVTVTVTPGLQGVTLSLDGAPLEQPEMPLILPPGDHRLVAHAEGRRDSERSLRVASGDEIAVELVLSELPPQPAPPTEGPRIADRLEPAPEPAPARRRFAVGAAFGTNLRSINDTGAPSLSVGATISSRLEVGVEAVLVAYAVIPSLRVRLAGDTLSLHAIGAVPIAFPGDSMTSAFAAGAIGLGVRYRAAPALTFRLESFASFAGEPHGTTVPTFLGGELWF
ncbi:MAG TPA: tetratricopeptide repeat protein [Kofleriaceae bacterium]|nr:tetratricopeptide repeat protein [Kofleriaceae bacterium]